MIGCIGKALGKDLHMDKDEMDDVRCVRCDVTFFRESSGVLVHCQRYYRILCG